MPRNAAEAWWLRSLLVCAAERHGSRQPDRQRKLNIVVSAFITIDERLQEKGHVAQLKVATPTQFLSDIRRDVPRPSLGRIETDDLDRIAVLLSQHVLDHGLQIAGGIGFGPDLAAFTAIVHHEVDGLIVLAGHDRWCPAGPMHHQLQRMMLDLNRLSPNRSGRGIKAAVLAGFQA